MDTQPHETPSIDEDETEDSEERELMPDIYVQRDTSLIFEVKFFETFCLVRPATPLFYTAIKKMSHSEFADQFDEFLGDVDTVRDAIRGMTPDFIIE